MAPRPRHREWARQAAVLLLLAACLGCVRTMQVCTSPVQATVGLITPPAAAGGPVVEMPLDGAEGGKGTKVVILDVDGLLLNQNLTNQTRVGDNPVAVFREKLVAARADGSVCAVVLRINSPGGGATASDQMWQELKRFKASSGKPVVACIQDVAAGGAYYLATAADRIMAHPTSITGGIGVIWNSYNLRDFMALYNIVPQSLKAGPNIDMGTTSRPLSPEAKQLLQEIADEFHARFKSVVREGRPGVTDDQLFDGRVFTAGKALRAGLIDSVGYLDDAVALARTLAHDPRATAVMYHRCSDPAHSPYAISADLTPTSPLLPVLIPGLERSRLPTFLYLWQPEPTLDNR